MPILYFILSLTKTGPRVYAVERITNENRQKNVSDSNRKFDIDVLLSLLETPCCQSVELLGRI